jgi:hypothetical protein
MSQNQRPSAVVRELGGTETGLAPVDHGSWSLFEERSPRDIANTQPFLFKAIRCLSLVADDVQLSPCNPDPDRLATALQNHGALLDAALIDAVQQWLAEQK